MNTQTLTSPKINHATDPIAHHFAFIGTATELSSFPLVLSKLPSHRNDVFIDRVLTHEFSEYMNRHEAIVGMFFVSQKEEIPEALKLLRASPQHSKTRAYILVLDHPATTKLPSYIEELDVERIITREEVTEDLALQTIDNALKSYRALSGNIGQSMNYLDSKYNEVFDWFETTKWDWREVDLTKIEKHLVTEADITILNGAAVIEFGTLPGAHNFLREWSDEYSFSSWALSWGAEEARHSLVQSRYLRHLGIEVKSKLALYKREPYPIGFNRAGTLMMNIISEARAAQYYRTIAKATNEPVLKKIWELLGRDEARHARAFYTFCKELCDNNRENTVAALEMAYVWLADRSQGVKHPAGYFFPHGSSIEGLRMIEKSHPEMTDSADEKILSMIRNLIGNDSVTSVNELKRVLRNSIT